MTTHHPSSALLAGFAAGRAGAGVTLAVSCHLGFCPECRGKVAALEALAGVMLEAEPGREAALPGALLARLDAAEEPENSATLPWRERVPGVDERCVGEGPREQANLVRMAPGATIPPHVHDAGEIMVVLEGEVHDGEMRYGPGDVIAVARCATHQVRASCETACFCLSVLSKAIPEASEAAAAS